MENPGPAPSGGALQEKVIWTAHPSQITNLPLYSACLIVIAAIIAAFSAIQNRPPYLMIALGSILGVALIVLISRWIITRSRTYQVTTERIKVIEGILSRRTDELELYRVRDYKLTEPFWLRLFGLGNITISSNDNSTPTVIMHAIRDPNGRREELRKYVEACRDRKRVRVTEIES